MSNVNKIYFCFKKLLFFSRLNIVKNSMIFTFVFFLMLAFLFNSHAYTGDNTGGYDITKTYEILDEFSTESTGTGGRHSHKSTGFDMADGLGNVLDVVAPQANVNYANILENENIPLSAKLGLLGTTEYAVNALLHHPPNYQVGEHLAMEWVPYYKDSSTSVYASKSGYEQLMELGINDIWATMRNMAYLCFVLVFIAAGFMIMFRHKLGGQTMVTVYNTLPNIVVSLVLVTFSFAIVGLFMDFGVTLQNIAISIIRSPGDAHINPANPLDVVWRFGADGFMLDMGSDGFWNLGEMGKRFATGGFLKMFTGNSVLDLLVLTLASFVVLFAGVKIFVTLIKAYMGLILDTITGPIVLAISAIPGKKTLMSDWFKRIVKNVLVFVLVLVIVQLPLYLVDNLEMNAWDLFSSGLGKDRNFMAELDNTASRLIYSAISIYLFFLASNVPKMLDEYLQFAGGKGMGEAGKGVNESMSKVPGIGGFFK